MYLISVNFRIVKHLQLNFKRQFFSMSRICDKKHSKPKIFLAFLPKLLCFSFILLFIQLATFLVVSDG